MTTQDGPGEIDRKVSFACLYCTHLFQDYEKAKAHDATCPEHPAVQELNQWRLAALETRLYRSDIETPDAATYRREQAQAACALLKQLAVAKRFIARIIELYDKSYEVQGSDIWDAATETGILVKTKYDPALHGEQDAEVGDAWYVVAEEWRVDAPYRAARGASPSATGLSPEDAIRRGRE